MNIFRQAVTFFLLASFFSLDSYCLAERPYGAGSSDTSRYALGTYVWNVIFIQKEGGNSQWNNSRVNTHKQRVRDAARFWEDKANKPGRFKPGINWLDIEVNFVELNGSNIIELDDVSSFSSYPRALNKIDSKYSENGTLSSPREFNNDMRDAYGKNWSFTTFVRPWASRASALRNGPFTNAYRDDSWHTYKHELGHIFGAADEYAESGSTTSDRAGYLYAYNTNAAKHADGRNNSSSWSAMMKVTSSTSLSSGTVNAVGWRDTDNDQIPDILDTEPELFINSSDGNQINTTSYEVALSAVVNPLESPNPFIGNMTINTIESAEYRIDEGHWVDINAIDGSWGGYNEDFGFTATGLTYGDHTIDVRVFNSVGNYTSQRLSFFSAIPEPSTALLAMFAITGICRRKR